AERDFAHRERGVDPRIAPRDAHAFIGLDALACALDDLVVHPYGVAGSEFGHRARRRQLRDLLVLELLNDVHCPCPLNLRPAYPRRTSTTGPAAAIWCRPRRAPGARPVSFRGARKSAPPAPRAPATPGDAYTADARGAPARNSRLPATPPLRRCPATAARMRPADTEPPP